MKPRFRLDLSRLRGLRKHSGLNQHDFWTVFGVTQSGGFRYENRRVEGADERRMRNDRPLPKPVALLLQLRHSGRITDDDLGRAARAQGWPRRKARSQ